MNPFGYTAVLVFVFVAMEGVTWCTHKFVMHGFLWTLHEDHHRPGKGFFEKNDLFFLIFAVPSFCAILWGTLGRQFALQAAGFGVMAYGMAYFLVHDVVIHRRFNWFSRSDSGYVRAVRLAHKMHHKHLGKEDGEAFGLLFVARKYRKKIKQNRAHA